MGREIRSVPAGWEHPRYSESDAPRPNLVGKYRPQFEKTVSQAMAEDPELTDPNPAFYRPDHLADGDHFQMYECTTEGTPISPVFPTLEGLFEQLLTKGDCQGIVWSLEALGHVLEGGPLATSDVWKHRV